MTITELSIKRPILVIVAFLAITLIGLFAYSNLKYETFPSMTAPVVAISTTYSGASASVVESTVTKKIEDAISGINNVDTVSSTSQEGLSTVTVTLRSGADVNVALQDVQSKINQIADELPDDADTPTYSKFSSSDRPVMQIGVTSNMNGKDFYQYLTDTIKPQLAKQPGVGQITLVGGIQREIRVNVDSQKLQAYGISSATVTSAIANANLDYPTGKVKDEDGQYVLRLSGKINSLEELRSLIVKRSSSGNVVLSDIADVQDGNKDQGTINRVNGAVSVGIRVYKQSDANEVEVCQAVRKTLQRLEDQNRSLHLKFVVIEDNSTYTIDSANAVKEDLGIAIVLVAIVMLLFLHSLRNALIVMVAIPTSLVATFIGMWATGCTMNIITLLAMSLVIGILVDDSIVVLENIHHHLELGEEKRAAALKGRNEIGLTALSITLVDVVVFLPLTLVSGMIGGILHQFSLVVVMSTLVSLFVSFTVTPMLASRFSKAEALCDGSLMGRFGLWFEAKYNRMVESYLQLLNWCLENRGKVLLLVGALFVAVLALIPAGFIGSEFMPSADQGQLTVKIELPTRAKLEQTNQMTEKAERMIRALPEVAQLFTTVGTSDNAMAATSTSNSAEIEVVLVDKKQRSRSTDEVVHLIKDKMDQLPGIVAHVNASSVMGGGQTPIRYVVTGVNWNKAYQGALQVKQLLARIPGTKDLQLSTENAQPEVQIQIDREKMTQLGLSISDIGSVLQTGYTGDTSSKFRDQDGTEYDIRIIYDSQDRSRTSDVGAQSFVNDSGEVVQLNQFATLVNGAGPNKLSRQDRNYAITVSSQAVGRTSGSIAGDFNKLLARARLPEGVAVMPGGMLKEQGTAFGSLGLALLAAVIFVYLIMTALYNSFIYPFVVGFSVPLALIGAILGLGLTGNSLAIFSILGIIMQVGLVSKNAILLVDFANRAREAGAGVKEALLEAGRERIRPILMTTLTMILGMLPLALSNTTGSEFKHGMGWALIGGLTSSMLMTLIVVPIVYTLVEQVRVRIVKERGSAAA
ncbi:HAE1 family hydrophobic/amphiphilic exporter-1 [Hydrogenispora ethanolica]|uniref:HAE1 family hydrophobic/amphiphilic exporter-1 n=1 Tax=Hydrogenispora ethanolica TaxID=1082276 RepID=A0A4R1RZV6_HYDET|nr:efflux RND transporter permease subunit [Hydrogenispora ethanolica]TCL72395.1 HAE1 family hydrophobic/amphiphilic exporter-1 [Hydrogenispora ethanolica]